jgi:predicted MPP superfamily phosphohydrolase
VVNSLARAAAVAAAAGAAAVGWGAGVEVRSFRLRRVSAPVLAPGSRPVQVLHISDLHLVPRQERKRQFVRALARLSPDLVVDTGDHLAAVDGLPALLDTLEPLLEFPGCFVYGSNDYVAPEPRNPVNYLLPASVKKRPDIDNATARIALADGRTAALAGVDDPHVGRDDTDVLAVAPPEADVRIAVAHAPYRRILDTAIGAGWPLVMCGHTHGGQLCLPGWGALVSNCDLPVRQASGLSRWSAPDGRSGWLHVSAGLGTSPFVPIRFACPPAATLLTLEPPAA